MDLQLCYNASEDTFPLPPHIKLLYGTSEELPDPQGKRVGCKSR